MKKCPYCGGEIQDAANKCKHCRENIAEETATPLDDVSPDQNPVCHPGMVSLIVIPVLFSILAVAALVTFVLSQTASPGASRHVSNAEAVGKSNTVLEYVIGRIRRDIARQRVDKWLEQYVAGQAPYRVQGVSGYSLAAYKILKSSNGVVTTELVFKNQRGGDIVETHNFQLNSNGEIEIRN